MPLSPFRLGLFNGPKLGMIFCAALILSSTYLSFSQGRVLPFAPPLFIVKNANSDRSPLPSSPSGEGEIEKLLPSLCPPATRWDDNEASGGERGPLWCLIMSFASPQTSTFPYGKRKQ